MHPNINRFCVIKVSFAKINVIETLIYSGAFLMPDHFRRGILILSNYLFFVSINSIFIYQFGNSMHN